MKKVLVSVSVIGFALVAFAGCTQQVVPEPVKVVIPTKCDMGKATSKIAKCGSGD